MKTISYRKIFSATVVFQLSILNILITYFILAFYYNVVLHLEMLAFDSINYKKKFACLKD